MLKKLLSKSNIKKLIVFIVLEIFIFSIVPIGADEVNVLFKDINNSNKAKIYLEYKYDENKNVLKLSWNRRNDNERYYVFKKNIKSEEFELVNGFEGIKDNFYTTTLNNNIGTQFLVCCNDKLNEIPDNIKIFTQQGKKKDIVISFKSLRNAEYIESNIIKIIPGNIKKNIFVKKYDKGNWINKENKGKTKVLNSSIKKKLEKIKKEITVNVNNDRNKDSINDNNNEEIKGLYWINAHKNTLIEYMDVKLEIPSGSTPADSYVYIKPLTKDEMVKVSGNSTNLTLEGNGIIGYDISLNGDSNNKFLKDIKISIKYDNKKIPQDINKSNVFAYYFDENKGSWQYLKRDSLDNGYITSITNHFCQFYAGTMSIQSEPPQSKGINTNPINIKEVDPMAGIKGVPGIEPNNFGTASFSYPVTMPAGINDFTPDVMINYSNNSGEGTCGYGWNLGIGAITIDTKDGVPKYDGNETLLLNGKELVNTGSSTYRSKNEGTFEKIVKSGDGFIVYHIDGKKVYYGQNDASRMYDPDIPANIFIWYINKIEDKFGNTITYEYEEILQDNIRVNLYLKTIKYGYNDAYSVNFNWDNRNDIRTSYRSTFLIKNNKILKSIEIKYKDEILKKEELTYIAGAFNKSLLSKLEEKTSTGNVLNSFTFEYDTEITSNFTELESSDYCDKYSYSQLEDGHIISDFIDLNNDGLPERVKKAYKQNLLVAWNKGNKFTQLEVTDYYDKYALFNKYDGHMESDFIDLNGDGLPERLKKGYEQNLLIAWNIGDGFTQLEETDYYDKYALHNKYDGHMESDFIDLNGDGFSDRVKKGYKQNLYVSWNIGDGFTQLEETDYYDKYALYNKYDGHIESGFADLNGDGLPDRIKKGYKQNLYVAWNKGNGFTPLEETDYYDKYAYRNNYEGQLESNFIDLNGDRLPDRVKKGLKQNLMIAWNTGDGFTPLEETDYYDVYCLYFNFGSQNITGFADINGDGCLDRIEKVYLNNLKVAYNLLTEKNILKKIINNTTSNETNLEYDLIYVDSQREISKYYKKKLVLTKISTGNPDLTMIDTDVEYQDGIYDNLEKEFRGFEKLTVINIDKENNTKHIKETTYNVTDYSGTDSCNNKLYDQYLCGQIDTVTMKYQVDNSSDPIILSKHKNEYVIENILTGYNDVKFVYPVRQRSWIYDYNENFLGIDSINGDITTETSYIFDYNNGLITKSTDINYNDPNILNDDIKTLTDIAVNTVNWISVPYKSENIDINNGTKISEKTVYYDNQAEGVITEGKVTGEEVWNNNGDDPVKLYQYDLYGNVIKITDPTGLETNITVNYNDPDYYVVTTKSLPNGLTETEKINKYGRKAKSIDIYGDISEIIYDDYGRIIELNETIDGILKLTKKFSYSTITDNNKTYFKTEAEYLDDLTVDGFIIIQFIKDSLGRNVQTKKESVINGVKCWTVSGYLVRDIMNRAIEQGIPTTTDYTEEGIIDNSTASLEYSTTFEYDELGRFVKAVMPNGYEVYKEYNIEKTGGKILTVDKVSDSEGKENTTYTDMLKNIVKTVTKDGLGQDINTIFEYTLHGWGKVTEYTGATGEKQLDSLGRLQWMRSPDAGKFEYTYNTKGLISTVTKYGRDENDGNTRIINYIYDSLNRITDVDYAGSTDNDIHYEYYTNSEMNKYEKLNIKSIAKGTNYSVNYNFGQLWIEEEKTIETNTYSTKYTYDVQGRIDNVVYPDGETVNYNYDEGGYLNSIIGNQIYIENIKYNEMGQRTYLKYGNGNEINYTYTPETGLLDTMKQKDQTGLELLNYDYDFDLTGNLLKLTDAPGGVTKSIQNYTYDINGRIHSASGDYNNGTKSYNRTYKFDANNRIEKKTHGNGMIYDFKYTGDGHEIDHIIITDSPDGKTKVGFSYDDFGNMTKKDLHNLSGIYETTDYIYDEANKLVHIDLPDGTDLDFTYDNKGARLIKEYSDSIGTIKKSVYVNGFYTVIDEAQINKHISDGKYIVATKVDNNSDNILYYTQNNIGSTSMLTDKGGEKLQGYLYTPFGENWVTENAETPTTNEVTRKFTGQQFDKESGLYYYNARYYDPDIGIFMKPDPGMDGLNHYAYCDSNPIKYTDPTGMWSKNGGYGFVGWSCYGGGIHSAATIGIIAAFNHGAQYFSSTYGKRFDQKAFRKSAGKFFQGFQESIAYNVFKNKNAQPTIYGSDEYQTGVIVGDIASLGIAAGEIAIGLKGIGSAIKMFKGSIKAFAGGPLGIIAGAVGITASVALAVASAGLVGLGLHTGWTSGKDIAQRTRHLMKKGGHNTLGSNKSKKLIKENWSEKTTFKSKKASAKYHWKKHGKGRSFEQYTNEARNFYKDYQKNPSNYNIDVRSDGKVKITGTENYGIFDEWGKIISFE